MRQDERKSKERSDKDLEERMRDRKLIYIYI